MIFHDSVINTSRPFLRRKYLIPLLTNVAYSIWDYQQFEFDQNHTQNYIYDELYINSLRKNALDNLSKFGPSVQKALISIDHHGANYYHFLSHTLPDILALRRIVEAHHLCYDSILVNDLPKYSYQYFTLFDIKERIYPIRNVPISVEDCILPEVHYEFDKSFNDLEGLLSIRKLINQLSLIHI